MNKTERQELKERNRIYAKTGKEEIIIESPKDEGVSSFKERMRSIYHFLKERFPKRLISFELKSDRATFLVNQKY